ncbi:MAG: hypothetical protein LBV49_11510, partial [Azonexus sp.]|nr:hypothetical protein [Azonexus sp.]
MKFRFRHGMIALAGALYLWLSYVVTTDPAPSLLAVIFTLLPFFAAAAIGVWKSPHRPLALALSGAALALLIFNSGQLYGHIAWLFFLQHIGAQGAAKDDGKQRHRA